MGGEEQTGLLSMHKAESSKIDERCQPSAARVGHRIGSPLVNPQVSRQGCEGKEEEKHTANLAAWARPH